MLGMGFVKTFEQMAALRVILGILEAGFFPSCVYLLSTWYTRCKASSLPIRVTCSSRRSFSYADRKRGVNR